MVNDLKSMSRKELEKLLKDVQLALKNAKARDLREAKRAAQKAAAEYGFSLGEITDEEGTPRKAPKKKTKKPAKKAPPKYADPNDPSRTWTGKGRQPNWFRAAVEKGADPSSMLI